MRVADYYTQGRRSFFWLHEKGGRYNVVPAHHLAQEYVDALYDPAKMPDNLRAAHERKTRSLSASTSVAASETTWSGWRSSSSFTST